MPRRLYRSKLRYRLTDDELQKPCKLYFGPARSNLQNGVCPTAEGLLLHLRCERPNVVRRE